MIERSRDAPDVLMVVPYPLEQVAGVSRWAIEAKPWIERKTGGTVTLTFPEKKNDKEEDLPEDYYHLGKVRFSFQHHDTHYQSSGWISPKKAKEIYSARHYDIVHLQEPLAGTGLATLGFILGLPKTENGEIIPALLGHLHMTRDNLTPFTKFIIRSIKLLSPYHVWIMKQLDRTLAASQATVDSWSQFWPVDYDIVPNGTDTAKFSPDGPIIEEWRKDPKKKTILFLGRHDRRKNLEGLVSDYSIVRKTRDDVQLKIGGAQGFTTNEVKKMIEKEGIPDVEFIDTLPGEVLPMAHRSSDIFGGAYSTDGEAHNRTAAEAFSCAVMVPVTDIKGHEYAFGGVKSAIFVKPYDQESRVRALNTILDLSEEDRKRLGREGREYIVRNYDWDIVTDRLVREEYEEAVREKRNKLGSSGAIYRKKH